MCVCACAHTSAVVSCVGGEVTAAAELRGTALADQPDPLQTAVVRHARTVPHEVPVERLGSRHGGRAHHHRYGVFLTWYDPYSSLCTLASHVGTGGRTVRFFGVCGSELKASE